MLDLTRERRQIVGSVFHLADREPYRRLAIQARPDRIWSSTWLS